MIDKEKYLDGLMLVILAIVFPPAALLYAIAIGDEDEN